MATKTVGTPATTTLTAIQWLPGYQGIDSTHATDFATITAGIYADGGQPIGSNVGTGYPDDGGTGNKPSFILQGAIDKNGWVTLPGGRGRIRLTPGDWICTDGGGNVYVVPVRALPTTLTLANCTTVNASPAITTPSDVRVLAWQNGTAVSGTNIPSGSIIGDLNTTGTGFNLYSASTGLKVNATGSASNVTITAGTFTHS